MFLIENKQGEKVETTLEEVILSKANHDIEGDVTFSFSEDGKSATASFNCSSCHKALVEEASVNSTVTKNATCTSKGETTYTATYLSFSANKVLEDIPATGHKEANVTKVNGREAECDLPGFKDAWLCTDCKHYYSSDDMLESHLIGDETAYETWKNTEGKLTKEHQMNKHEEIKPTCSTYGSKAFYSCSGCGLFYEDELGNKLIGDVIYLSNWLNDPKGGQIEKDSSNHSSSLVNHSSQPSTCISKGNKEYWTCATCNGIFIKVDGVLTQVNSINDVILPTDNNAHNLTKIAEVPATPKLEGIKEHWVCSLCGKSFLKNEAGQYVEANALDLVIARLPEQKSGCGASLASGGIIFLISLIGMSTFFIKKRQDTF